MYSNGPVFKAETTMSFRDQPYAGQLPQGLWTTGLCDCHEDPQICFQTAVLPCITFGQNSEIVSRGTIPWSNSSSIHMVLSLVGCCCIYGFPNRTRLREHLSLPEEPCRDCLLHIFCTHCALCQESRELKNRGADPSIGWQANIEKWSEEKITPPIVVPGMSR
ncbi:PREDICTED: protein PLANT CADMIUM RESISTANCE 12 [Tarenaya hassleriana]|uniref:protein PLANT CADMIUM RESISTANCE 12 n=1 Tax=Tarenaya hassleriana TaxID=28532 RepID=UPI00053C275D|nr:PREDICTED: protein PLANT CADMIUM RESISTANCE 12 [Tarenaya hassleriana]